MSTDQLTVPAVPSVERSTDNLKVQTDVANGRPKFAKNDGFQAELRKRVDAFLRSTGRRERDCPQMYLKTLVILSVFAIVYYLLVFVAQTWWQALPLSMLLALATAGIGFNIQHDGGHNAYSNRKWVNNIMAMTMDMIGASSYMWHWKHVVFHHTYTNITGHDTDIELGVLGRLSPHQKRLYFHRWQHYYLWPLYGLIGIKWHLFDDFHDVILGRVGDQKIPRPRGWDLVVFLAGKVLFFSLAFGIPLLLHAWWIVLIFYAVTELTLGIVLSIVFQSAHCVEGATFVALPTDTKRIENAWAVHQAESTVDFAQKSRLLSWLLGGLNFQIEHHLFPRICHVNYPAISKVVQETCQEYGVKYQAHRTFAVALRSHFRWLREMGMATTESTINTFTIQKKLSA